MRMGVTINVGNYQNIRLDSNEYPTTYDCAAELIHELRKLKDTVEVDGYIDSILKKFIDKPYTLPRNRIEALDL